MAEEEEEPQTNRRIPRHYLRAKEKEDRLLSQHKQKGLNSLNKNVTFQDQCFSSESPSELSSCKEGK
jgi:hypothetical protein